jgi:hypothetical protein
VFPDGFDGTVIPNDPCTCPLKLPLKVNEPVAVPAFPKHAMLEFKDRLVMVTDPSPFTRSDVPNVKLGLLPLSSRVAFQVPLMLAGFELFEPHPTKAKLTKIRIVTANCFIR